MERVKRTALSELQRKIDNANQELMKQMDYRHSLSCQIRENERHLVSLELYFSTHLQLVALLLTKSILRLVRPEDTE